MAYDLAIVLPTFNESGNVGPIVDRLEKALKGIRYEVIFVDDDSPDGTADVVRRLARDRDNLRVLQRIGRRGLASACIEGILAAAAPYVAVMDADLQHDESILPEMLRRIREENLDLVVGSRNIAGGSMGEFAALAREAEPAGQAVEPDGRGARVERSHERILHGAPLHLRAVRAPAFGHRLQDSARHRAFGGSGAAHRRGALSLPPARTRREQARRAGGPGVLRAAGG